MGGGFARPVLLGQIFGLVDWVLRRCSGGAVGFSHKSARAVRSSPIRIVGASQQIGVARLGPSPFFH